MWFSDWLKEGPLTGPERVWLITLLSNWLADPAQIEELVEQTSRDDRTPLQRMFNNRD